MLADKKFNLPACTDSTDICITDPAQGIKQMFVDQSQFRNNLKDLLGQEKARRAVFRKVHGVAAGTFTVEENIPAEYKVGIFKHGKQYQAMFRFSSDTAPTLPDYKSTLGIGIKLWGVEGKKVLPQEADSNTADFILQNFPVFFVKNATEMCQFTRDPTTFYTTHPETQDIINNQMKKPEPSVFTNYWSCLPYKIGDTNCKYLIRPRHALPPLTADPGYDYLRAEMKKRTTEEDTILDFFVQLNRKNNPYDIENAMQHWDETDPVPHKVATIRLPKISPSVTDVLPFLQSMENYVDDLSFSPWRALPENAPLGSVAEARKVVYKASADQRRNINGAHIAEPFVPFCPIHLPQSVTFYPPPS